MINRLEELSKYGKITLHSTDEGDWYLRYGVNINEGGTLDLCTDFVGSPVTASRELEELIKKHKLTINGEPL